MTWQRVSPAPPEEAGTPVTPAPPSSSPGRSGDRPEGSARGSTRWAIARLVVVLAAIVAVFLVAGLGDLLIFVAALVGIVILHELSHFLTAKWSHMKVTEFFIGFGPRLWSVRKGETEYGIKPILAGAYVKIPGMTNLEKVDADDEARSYRQQPFRKRILVASAGSVMHYLIALVLGIALALSVGVPSGTKVTVTGFTSWAGHHENAAQLAGIKSGDRIVSVGGKKVSTSTQLSRDIQASDGRAVKVVVERAGHFSTLTVHPQAGHLIPSGKTKGNEVLGKGSGKTQWLIGVVINEGSVFTSKNPWDAAAWAGSDVGNITRLTVVGIGHVFSPSGLSSLYHQVTNSRAGNAAAATPGKSNRLLTVVGAARLATQAEAQGPYYFISILIALNIALGLLNMLPMLPLDGGHVAIALYERVRTRRRRPYYQADVAKLMPVAYAFIAVLLLIFGSALFLDIAHPVANPFG